MLNSLLSSYYIVSTTSSSNSTSTTGETFNPTTDLYKQIMWDTYTHGYVVNILLENPNVFNRDVIVLKQGSTDPFFYSISFLNNGTFIYDEKYVYESNTDLSEKTEIIEPMDNESFYKKYTIDLEDFDDIFSISFNY